MDYFVSFAWMGGTSVGAILLWRLFVAIDTQRKLEMTLASNLKVIDAERQELGTLMESQTLAIEALTQENSALKQQAEQRRLAYAQLQSDHQALQEKYGELEQDLLAKIAKGKTLSETLHAQKLEQARLHRQVESVQERQIHQEREQQSLQQQHQQVTDKNQLYQKAVKAAKAKISELQQEKKQLERDLQQALYQVVALEQDQNIENLPRPHEVPVGSLPDESLMEPSLPRFG